MDREDWKRKFVWRWADLVDGKYDMHSTWDWAEELYLQHRGEDPERVADAQFVASIGPQSAKKS